MIKKFKYILIGLGILGVVYFGGGEKNEVSLEKLTTKYDASIEIKAKYSLEGASLIKTDIKNSELDRYKGEPKDEVKVTLGDKDKSEFTPEIELKRWNEVGFKIKPKGLEGVATKDKTLSFNGDRVKYDTPKMSFEMYDYAEGEGGYKYIWYLNEKPASNVVEFDIETSGLDFFYQPPLTQEYQNGYSEEFQKEIIVTETQVKDSDGNVLVERPIEVVNSYAVYHSTKGGMNDAYGKDYKIGKAFHIYRPHLFDANGLEAWGNLHIENGIYSVEIPQDFLDKAVYPIKSNDTFGYTSIGAGNTVNIGGGTTTTDDFRVRTGTPASSGTVDSASVYANRGSAAVNIQMKSAIYNTTPTELSPNSNETTLNSATPQWWDLTFTSGPSIRNAVYWVLVSFDSSGGTQGTRATLYFDTGGNSGDSKFYNAAATCTPDYSNPPTDFSSTCVFSNSINIYSIYATYTPSGGGGTPATSQIIIIDALPTLNNNQS